MSLKKQIEEKLNEALKAKDKNTYPTLRLVVSAIKDVDGNTLKAAQNYTIVNIQSDRTGFSALMLEEI